MVRSGPFERAFALGSWSVDPARGVLARDGTEKRIEPQLMDLLLLFAGSAGRVLSKDEIVASVWRGRAIGDDTLAAALSRLRAALGETKTERYIETLPKRGYRLAVRPEGREIAHPHGSESDETASLVAKGRAALKTPLASSLAQARLYFERAIAADPKAANAHAGLAETFLTQHLARPAGVLLGPAKASALAAVALDGDCAPAHAALGMATLLADRDFSAADRSLLKAIALDPGRASFHSERGFVLASVGRFVEAEREVRRAIEIDPFSLAARSDLAQILILARRYAQAATEATRTLALNAHAGEAWAVRGWAHALQGREIEARDDFLESLKAWNLDDATHAELRAAYERGGMSALCSRAAAVFETQKLLFAPRRTDIALLRSYAGEDGLAISALETAAAEADSYLLWVVQMPQFDRMRNNPEFVSLCERIRPVR